MRKKRAPILETFRAEIAGLSLDELQDLRVEIGHEHNDHVNAAVASRQKLDTIKSIMFENKNGGSIGISEHAVLRYLERHKGIDVRAIREEIVALAGGRRRIEGTEGHYDAGHGVTVVMPQDSVVATILDGRPIKNGGA